MDLSDIVETFKVGIVSRFEATAFGGK
jgi:hypothetical protein